MCSGGRSAEGSGRTTFGRALPLSVYMKPRIEAIFFVLTPQEMKRMRMQRRGRSGRRSGKTSFGRALPPSVYRKPRVEAKLFVLTPQEMKKMRTQRRQEREKERQDLIRQGLLEAPAPKVKLSNLMRVLGEEATADPTAVEAEVRKQMSERQQVRDLCGSSRPLCTPFPDPFCRVFGGSIQGATQTPARKDRNLLPQMQELAARKLRVQCRPPRGP